MEIQLLNSDGYVVFEADKVLSEVKKINKNIPVVKECSKNMVELCSFPSVKVQNTLFDSLNTLQIVLEVAQKNDFVVYPLSVYPGKFVPEMRQEGWYGLKSKIIYGKKEFLLAGKTSAFHYHYTLPKGVFDKKKRYLKPLINSKMKKTLINTYNLGIAADPALVTLFQSSPVLDGKFIAKDCRVVIQRTGRVFPFKGVYHKQPKFGGLPIYKTTLTDLTYTIDKRWDLVKSLMTKNNIDSSILKKFSKLDFSWHSLRINKLGTLEQRTMDMNHPKYIIAGTILLKYIFRKIQQDFLSVVPSDVGLEEPFKVEGNVLHIPPHTFVRKNLQYHSAYEGLSNKTMRKYCKRFYRFARQCTPPEFYKAIQPIGTIINRNKTVSDILIRKFRKKGYKKEDTVPNNVCAEVALSSCKQLNKEIEKTKKLVEGLRG